MKKLFSKWKGLKNLIQNMDLVPSQILFTDRIQLGNSNHWIFCKNVQQIFERKFHANSWLLSPTNVCPGIRAGLGNTVQDIFPCCALIQHFLNFLHWKNVKITRPESPFLPCGFTSLGRSKSRLLCRAPGQAPVPNVEREIYSNVNLVIAIFYFSW